MEHRWNEIDRGKPKCSGKNLSQCQFVHHKSHWTDPGSNPGLRGGRPASTRLSHASTVYFPSLQPLLCSYYYYYYYYYYHYYYILYFSYISQCKYNYMHCIIIYGLNNEVRLVTRLWVGQSGVRIRAATRDVSLLPNEISQEIRNINNKEGKSVSITYFTQSFHVVLTNSKYTRETWNHTLWWFYWQVRRTTFYLNEYTSMMMAQRRNIELVRTNICNKEIYKVASTVQNLVLPAVQ
jgi:hypothetical protein